MTRTYTEPATNPIHLYGEADAYPGESYDNAYARLFDYGCQCGWMTMREVTATCARVYVYNGPQVYRLTFSPDTLTLSGVDSKHADDRHPDQKWRVMWTTLAHVDA